MAMTAEITYGPCPARAEASSIRLLSQEGGDVQVLRRRGRPPASRRGGPSPSA